MDGDRAVNEPIPNPKLMRVLRIAVGVVVVFIALILLLSYCGRNIDPEPAADQAGRSGPPAAPTIATADPAVRSVAKADGVLRVDVLISTAWDEADYPTQTAMILEAIGEAIQAGADDAAGAERLALSVSAPSTDRLGREGEVGLYTLFFDMEDLRQAEFDNLAFGRTLNLVEGASTTREGLTIGAIYCASERGRAPSAAFCETRSFWARSRDGTVPADGRSFTNSSQIPTFRINVRTWFEG